MSEAQRERIYLVDAMGFIFRAYHAPMERLRSPAGMPTKVPYVFANMLRRLVRERAPDYLAVVFDTPEPTFRDELFAAYKAERPPMPEDLAVQLPYVRRVCEAMRLPIVERPGYEADDVIGALARQAAARGMEVVIVTSDKDMLQLVGGPVRVFIPTKNDLDVDAKKVEELMGVPPEKIPDLMALMGDAIDGIPGARGIGEKGARELIATYGSAEAALEHAAEVKSKRYREALESGRDIVLLSKRLATIQSDAPVELAPDALRLSAPDTEALRALYTELGFTSLLRELSPAAPSTEATDYATVESPAELRKFFDSLPAGEPAAVWFELVPPEGGDEDDGPGYGWELRAVEISPRAGVARVVRMDDAGKMLAELAPWLADPARPKIVHDPKLAELAAGEVRGVRDAVMLYSYLLRPQTAKHSLEEIVLRRANTALAGAAGERADWLARLAGPLRAEVEAQGLLEVYEKIDLPLSPVLARMERAGVGVDPAALAALSDRMETEVRRLERKCWELAGQEFNVNSPQQLAEILFDKLALEPPRRGRGKPRSTAADVLGDMAARHPLPAAVIEYREVAKLKSTYADALPRLIHPRTGRIHTRLSQTGTATGRLASSSPNLQNIPVRTELGREIRAAFTAAPGSALFSADYSQIELRLLAHCSEDSVLVEAFRTGQDIHARTAQEVFGVAPALQTAEHRRAAKAINFGIIYGLSSFGLGQQLGIEPKEAAKFIAAYFERYRGVKEFLDAHLDQVRKDGFTRTLFGRVRPIPEINATQGALRGMGERMALNTPLQGTAADLIKLAMIEIDRRLAEENFRARMILQVHDELLFETPADELEKLRALVVPAMENVHALRVPLVVETKTGLNWRDMQ
jgi:DNA polymerase-1